MNVKTLLPVRSKPRTKSAARRDFEFEQPTSRLRAAMRDAESGRGQTFSTAATAAAYLESCVKKSR